MKNKFPAKPVPVKIPSCESVQQPELARFPYTVTHLAECLELPDRMFVGLIKTMESDRLFRRLYFPSYQEERVISMKRFPHTDLAPFFYRHVKALPCGTGVRVVKRVMKEVGGDHFLHFFIYNEAHLTPEQIAANCGLSIDTVLAVQEYLNSAYSRSGRIALIRKQMIMTSSGHEDEKLVILFFMPALARGRYIIDYQRLSYMNSRLFSLNEQVRIKQLIRTVEVINLRKQIMHRLIIRLLESQRQYFVTGDPSKKAALSQVQMAHDLCVDKSVICRSVKNRSIVFNGSTIPLSELFLKRNAVVQHMLRTIIEEERKVLSDEQLRKKLFLRFHIGVSRRSVAMYRKALSIPPSFQRAGKKLYVEERVRTAARDNEQSGSTGGSDAQENQPVPAESLVKDDSTLP